LSEPPDDWFTNAAFDITHDVSVDRVLSEDDIRKAIASLSERPWTAHTHIVHARYHLWRVNLTGHPDAVTRCASCMQLVGVDRPEVDRGR
jgi:hypothetical protein